MKTTKIFLMAALALTFAACSNDDNDIQTTPQPAKGEGITITATLAPKSGNASTRKVTDGTDKIVASWAANEHIAILYTVGSEKKVADAKITSVDETTGVATISFTVVDETPDNTECTLVYPKDAAKDDNSGVKDAATLLAAQDGTLNANLDVRVGAGTIQTTTPGLTVTTQPAAQFAIFKFSTVKDAASTPALSVKPLVVTIGTQYYVITPSSATSTLYAALPAVSSQTVSFSATGSDSKAYVFSKDGVSFAKGKYYQSTLKMAEISGALGGLFSVSASKKVFFSKGNLKYNGSAWSFFDKQYEYFTTHDGTNWDKFGWSTSATTYGMNTSTDDGTYSGDFVDWGATMGTGWRTLTKDEWTYLFGRTVNGGTGNGKSYTLGQGVNGKLGIVIYPDDYTGAAYSGSDWSTFEAAGCVFLPAAGFRQGTSVYAAGSRCLYWSSSYGSDAKYAYLMEFSSGALIPAESFNRSYAFSVRLVRPVE